MRNNIIIHLAPASAQYRLRQWQHQALGLGLMCACELQRDMTMCLHKHTSLATHWCDFMGNVGMKKRKANQLSLICLHQKNLTAKYWFDWFSWDALDNTTIHSHQPWFFHNPDKKTSMQTKLQDLLKYFKVILRCAPQCKPWSVATFLFRWFWDQHHGPHGLLGSNTNIWSD